MRDNEYCGAPYDHPPHPWQSGPPGALWQHHCSGIDEEQADIDAVNAIDERLFDQGYFG